jgi:hypothetical protein
MSLTGAWKRAIRVASEHRSHMAPIAGISEPVTGRSAPPGGLAPSRAAMAPADCGCPMPQLCGRHACAVWREPDHVPWCRHRHDGGEQQDAGVGLAAGGLTSRKFQMSGSWPFSIDWRARRRHPLFTGTDPSAGRGEGGVR